MTYQCISLTIAHNKIETWINLTKYDIMILDSTRKYIEIMINNQAEAKVKTK